MKITRTKNKSPKEVKKNASGRMRKAKMAYQKVMLELTPFLPKTKSKEMTTEGTWQKTSSFSLY